jgi:hypothetical protein
METLTIYSKSKSNAQLLMAFAQNLGDIIVEKIDTSDFPQTHLASENVLAKEWLTIEEDCAWKNL